MSAADAAGAAGEKGEEVVVIRQSRASGAATAVAAFGAVALGWWMMRLAPEVGAERIAGALATVFGAGLAALGLLSALKPRRLIISPDGIDATFLVAARSAAWEEVAAIGRVTLAGYGHRRGGVRIALLDGSHLDVGDDWPIAPDALAELLTDAWRDFTRATALSAGTADEPPPADEPLAGPAPPGPSIVESA